MRLFIPLKSVVIVAGSSFGILVFAGESYEASFSASSTSQMQSCTMAQDQAERVARNHFQREVAGGAALSISDKHCECSKSTKYASLLYECMGYATGAVQDAAPFDDSNCASSLTSGGGQATWTLRMSSYLTCVRQLPDYNKSWSAPAMEKVRQQQQSEAN